MLKQINIEILTSLQEVISQLKNKEYSLSIKELSGSSIGKHTRHILDFYFCILNETENIICYDSRNREELVETQVAYTISQINEIKERLAQISEDKIYTLQQSFGSQKVELSTTLERELLYNIEHSIHHLAILKIGLQIAFPAVKIPQNFGIAYSTISHFEESKA